MSHDECHSWFYCHEQLTGVRFPDGSTRAAGFDNFNRQIWAVDERGVAVTNAYDKLDRLIASAYVPYQGASTLAGLPYTTTVPLEPSTCQWQLIYGGFANLIITNAYDTAGNLICTKDWAGITTNAFDALNRPILTFTHYLSSVTNRVQNTYDIIGNRLRADYTINGVAHTITNAYDQLDRLVSVTHPQSRISAIYAYNANGKLASNTYWNSSGRVACQINTYDAEQRLVLAAARKYNESLLVQRAFTYNNAQQIIRIEDTHNNHRWNYLYDNRDQLVNEEHNGAVWYNLAYSYDKAQNRTRTARNHGPDSTFFYSFANKLTNIAAGSATANHRYAYDSAGNLTNLLSSTATNRFFYNAQNKLVRIEGRGFTNEFLYDSQNRRIGVKLSGTWRYDVHDGNLCIGSVVNGLLDRFFVRGVGIAEGTGDIIAEIPDPRNPSPHPYYYISNHRGNTLVVLNDVYNIVARYEYDAYGNVIEKTGSYTPTYTFSSKEYLPAAKLYLYQYRAYDPIAGRWTQRDPIDYHDSINLYQFCGNNPVNATDPDGRAWSWAFAGVGAGVGAAGGFIYGACSQGISAARGKGFSWKAVGIATGVGASAGFVSGGIVGAATGDPTAIGVALLAGAVGGTTEGLLTAGADIVADALTQRRQQQEETEYGLRTYEPMFDYSEPLPQLPDEHHTDNTQATR